MDFSKAQKLKEEDLGKQLRSIRELQVAQYELKSRLILKVLWVVTKWLKFSKRSIYEQIPNSNVFLISTKHDQERRVKRETKKKVDQFKGVPMSRKRLFGLTVYL